MTNFVGVVRTFEHCHSTMDRLKIIAVTYQRVDVEEVGQFHLSDERFAPVLQNVKKGMRIAEMMYLSTCNRVEFVVVTPREIDNDWLTGFYSHLGADWSDDKVERAVLVSEVYEGPNAITHLFNVASSLDSMVLGEREIITQVRQAFEQSQAAELTGDFIRLLLRKTVETAKEIYTQTEIAARTVSMVSLAYHQLVAAALPLETRFLVVGAGQTNTTLLRFLIKHGYENFTIFNRTLSRAEALAAEVAGKACDLSELDRWEGGFDAILTCTGADRVLIGQPLYEKLLRGETNRKVVVDLAVPADFDANIAKTHPVTLIHVASLQPVADRNMGTRKKELQLCRAIIARNQREFQQMHRERQVELAMREVPGKVREIKEKALGAVFAKEIENLDQESLEVLDKVINYMEKKYISVPMKLAKQIMLDDKKGRK